jgi:hypothetical protein
MIPANRLKSIIVCFVAFMVSGVGIFAQPPSGQWNAIGDAQGKISKMSITNPHTPAHLEREIAIDIDKDGNPIRGEVTFTDGIKRELKPLETAYYWDELNGAHALWDYLASHGRVTVYASKTATLPLDAFGKQSRVLADDNREFIGRLNALPNNTDWFILDVEGSSLNVFRGAVREIQQIK